MLIGTESVFLGKAKYKLMKKLTLFLISGLLFLNVFSQKEITLEDMWYTGTFRVTSVYGINSMANGETYSSLNVMRNSIVEYEYKTGDQNEVLFKVKDFEDADINWIFDYKFNKDETQILISTHYEPIYRHSFKAEYYVYYIDSKELEKLSDNGKQQLASFSPDGSKIAFVRENNIYYKDMSNKEEIQVTTDGEWNHIINGAPDWVYEEEFSFSKAYEWSPDGKKIAFIKTDETAVKQFNMTTYGDLYPTEYEYKYPKAGEENSKVSVHIYDVESTNIIETDMGDLNDKYIPRIYWTQSPDVMAAVKMNRLQNKYELFTIDANTGNSQVLLTLNDKYYIEIADDLAFLPDGERFIITHEADGYRHIYMYDMNGELIKQITSGNWEVTDVYGYCAESNMIYYQSAESSPINREVCRVSVDDGKKKIMSKNQGFNEAEFSNSFEYYINYHSDANSPYFVSLHNEKGKLVRKLETNSGLKEKMKSEYEFAKKEFIEVPIEGGSTLNAWIIKPNDFDSSKEYPVLMYVYGGPGIQTVENSWDHNMVWWQMLAQKGYIIVSVDNRGTGARGKDFRQLTYGELGKYETEDQIEAAKYLSGLDYIDGERIGIFGWSFGGYLSALCMTIGADNFKTGIAVAPVTNWRYYDSIYTERYNGLPQDNPEGYDDNSPINHVKKLKGNFLLIHGTSDDNVHFQNSVDLVSELIKQNKQFDTMYYPNRDHSIYGDNARMHLYTKMTNFILENL